MWRRYLRRRMRDHADPGRDGGEKNCAASRRPARRAATLKRARRTARRAGSHGSLLRDGFVDVNTVKESFDGRAIIGETHLDRHVVQRGRQPDLRFETTVAALSPPDLAVDVSEGQRHRFVSDTMKDVMVDLARGRDIELRVFLAGGSEVELPYHCQRVERRQLEPQGLVV